MLEFLQGKKTYLIAIAMGFLTTAKALGWITEGTYQTLMGFAGAGAAITIRSGIESVKQTALNGVFGKVKL